MERRPNFAVTQRRWIKFLIKKNMSDSWLMKQVKISRDVDDLYYLHDEYNLVEMPDFAYEEYDEEDGVWRLCYESIIK